MLGRARRDQREKEDQNGKSADVPWRALLKRSSPRAMRKQIPRPRDRRSGRAGRDYTLCLSKVRRRLVVNERNPEETEIRARLCRRNVRKGAPTHVPPAFIAHKLGETARLDRRKRVSIAP